MFIIFQHNINLKKKTDKKSEYRQERYTELATYSKMK